MRTKATGAPEPGDADRRRRSGLARKLILLTGMIAVAAWIIGLVFVLIPYL